MATPVNRNNTRTGSGKQTASKTYTGIRYGNDHGSVNMGHIHKQGDVIADVHLQGSDGNHSFSLDKDGPRKGWTTSISPGNFQVQCGSENAQEAETLLLNAVNGNITIIATNGKLRFEANDIEFFARGANGGEGNITMNASEKFILEAKQVQISAKNFYRLATPGTAEIVANTAMKMYAPTIRGITDAVSNRDSKVGGRRFWNQNQK